MRTYIAAAFMVIQTAFAGESALTITYQPLDGLGSGEIQIVQVTCHDWYSHSGQATQIGLISAPNIPPTNNPKEAIENLNLASACGLRIVSSDIGDSKAKPSLTLDATQFNIPKRFGHSREDIIRATLECLRLCLPDQLRQTPILLACAEVDKSWLKAIISEFNSDDRSKAFFDPQS